VRACVRICVHYMGVGHEGENGVQGHERVVPVHAQMRVHEACVHVCMHACVCVCVHLCVPVTLAACVTACMSKSSPAKAATKGAARVMQLA
jgi:hypothetical protein